MTTAQGTPFGVLLKRLRLAAGLTQQGLSDRSGVSARAISDLERQPDRSPRPETVTQLADALGLEREARAQLQAAAWRGNSLADMLSVRDQRGHSPSHRLPSPVDRGSTGSDVILPALQSLPLLGRTEEVEVLRQLLVDGPVRLLTLTGPAGVGKTRLAREVVQRFGDAFPDGVWFIDLTAVRDPSEVSSVIARTPGLPDAGPDPPLERVSTYLQMRETLLILDNFEQVLPAAPLLDTLLVQALGLRFLVTSRQLLHLWTEQTLPVPPFPLPDPDHLPPLDQLAQIPSVALFLQRARMIDPALRLRDENARAIAELVVALDGLPLAIELAAARTRLLSPQMVLERLGQRLSLLHWEAPDLPVRQQTLRAAIAWSYDLITDEEQALFRRLGIFVGGFTLEAAEAIVSGEAAHTVDVLEGLASLADQSLVQSEQDGEGGHRFRLLESVRDFALEQVTGCGEGQAMGRAHARYFLELAERAAPELVGPEQQVWFLRLEHEHDNLRAALRWLWDHGESEHALRLAAALGYFWEVRGYFREGMTVLDKALALVPGADARLRARALNLLGSILVWQGESERSRVVLDEALALGRGLEDADIIARSLDHLARRVASLEPPEAPVGEAERLLEEALRLRQQLQDRRGAANIRTRLARIALTGRDYERGERLGQEALAAYQDVGDDTSATVLLILLGMAAGEQGDTARAVALLHQGRETSSRLQDRRLLLLVSDMVVSWLAGEQAAPRGYPPRVPEQLTVLLGAADAMADTIDAVPGGWRKAGMPQAAAELQAHLGTERFEKALGEGRSLSFSQISELVSLVLNEVGEGSAGAESTQREPGGAQRRHFLLSAREEEVLRLVADGLTNKEIARQLIITESTVKTHVSSLFNKLGVDSRAQAVAVAAQQGFLEAVTG
ncbi:MAG TPA: LuxR C-terminal-related transcriptional regulator [Chloroflexota bacterium]